MNRGLISSRYAKALYNYAANHFRQDAVYKDAVRLAQSYSAYPALRRVVANRLLSDEVKSDILKEASGGAEVSAEFLNFIDLVISQGRSDMLQEMSLDYQSIVRKAGNLMDVNLTTAIAMDEKTMDEFRRKMESVTGKTVILRPKVDPAIMGGYIMMWDTYRLDSSVRTQLERIKNYLTHVDYER